MSYIENLYQAIVDGNVDNFNEYLNFIKNDELPLKNNLALALALEHDRDYFVEKLLEFYEILEALTPNQIFNVMRCAQQKNRVQVLNEVLSYPKVSAQFSSNKQILRSLKQEAPEALSFIERNYTLNYEGTKKRKEQNAPEGEKFTRKRMLAGSKDDNRMTDSGRCKMEIG